MVTEEPTLETALAPRWRERLEEIPVPGVQTRDRPMAVAVAAITLAAVVARFTALFRDGLNSDEAVYSGQAAAIAGFQPYGQLFGIFRAHPLLVHFLVALGYHVTGVNDYVPRIVTATFGVAMTLVCLATAWVALGRLAGLVAGTVVAVCPYEVVVSRQMLLDGPAATFVALAMLLAALWVRTRQRRWLYAAAAACGLAFLSKETAILLLPAALILFLYSPRLPLRWLRDVPLALLIYAIIIAPYPLSLLLAGGQHTTGSFITWQFFRRPNHTPDFYPFTVLPAIGLPILILAALGLVRAIRRRQPMDIFAIAILVCFGTFFQVWPTKGFEYLTPLVPPIAYLAARGLLWLVELARSRVAALSGEAASGRRRWVPMGAALAGLLVLVGGCGLAIRGAPQQAAVGTSDATDQPVATSAYVAGTGGIEAGRPAGAWIRANAPANATFVTIGPTFANLVEFYGQRKALALSVSSNPLRRNPTYEPIVNPDGSIRDGDVQYLVYDAYSAARTPFFARKLLGYVKKYGAVPVYKDTAGGGQPAVVIYEVHA